MYLTLGTSLVKLTPDRSDIVAELPCPHSGILTYEEDMPHPNIQSIVDTGGVTPLIIESYIAQLFLRKHLNQLHNMFYKPEIGKSPQVAKERCGSNVALSLQIVSHSLQCSLPENISRPLQLHCSI